MSLINKRAVRKIILNLANSKYSDYGLHDNAIDSTGKEWDYSRANTLRKNKKFTQVTQKLLDGLDVYLRIHIESHLDNNPQSGKTVK